MASPDRWNILHLFTDQQRFDTIAALGNDVIQTPNLDRLVREGVAFTRAYTPSPECVPARAAMTTGRYPGRTGCFNNRISMPSEKEHPTFMERLTRAGYRTHGIGKCHFSPDWHALRGFQSRERQEERPSSRQEDDYALHLSQNGYDWVLEPHGVRGEMYYIPQPSPLPPTEHPSRWVAERSISFIREQAGQAAPWYLYSGFIHPHPPFAPPIPWHKLYRAPDMPLPFLPERVDELICFINRIQNRRKYRDSGLDLNLCRCIKAYYYACISYIDRQVGRIFAALEESGQMERTLIVYTADHGEYLGDYGCFGKRGMHDVSARIPLIARWPDGFGAGTRCSRPVSLVDLAPTFLQTAGENVASGEYDGVSLRETAGTDTGRDRVYAQFSDGPDGLYMGVGEKWKYIYSAPDQREYFFDLRNDPQEACNLALMSSPPPQLDRWRRDCQQWVRRTGQTEATDADGNWRKHPIAQLPVAPVNPNEEALFQDPNWWDGHFPD